MEALEERLRGRGTETDDKVNIRMKNAVTEMEYGKEENGNFDAIIMNEHTEVALVEITSLLKLWFPSFNFDDVEEKK